jgi:nitrate reductase NapA
MNKNMGRREFIIASAQLAALAALNPLSSLKARYQPLNMPDGLSWQKAPCRFCGAGCGVLVGIKGGRVVAVQGDRHSPVNKGLLCAKGYYSGAALYGKDRLKHPLIRKNGVLKKASWEEAIDLIARHVMKEPKQFSIYGSGQWTVTEGYIAMKFIKGGLGCNHIDPNARLCMASAVVGFITTFGVDEPSGCYDDLDVCDTVITWGNNWAETHPVLFSRFINRRSKGHKITYIDLATRFTRSSEAADHYIEFQPQSDLAIANCICQQLLAKGKWDRDFVSEKLRFKDKKGKDISLKEYQDFLAAYTPEKVSSLSGVSIDHLKMLADVFTNPDQRVLSLWCMGVNQHTRGTWMNNLIYNIHLLSGKFGKAGSTPFSLTGQPSACGTCREVGTLAHALPGGRVVKNGEHRRQVEDVWNTRRGAINPKPGFHTIRMFEAMVSGELTGMWVQVTNPAQSIPNLNKNLKHVADRFLVVSDVYDTETTGLATVVLPSALWVEKNGIFGNTERRTQQWFKMVSPPGEARDDVWQMLAVAHRMYELGFEGMKDRNGKFLLAVRDENGQEVEAWKWEVYKNFNADKSIFEEYRELSTLKHKDLAPYDEYVKARGLRWPVVKTQGRWRETKRRFVEKEDPFVRKGEGISFYMAKAGDKRAIVWARPYEAPPEMPDNDYPLWLCTGRVLEQWHTASMTGRIQELKDAMPEAYVELHPQDAHELGVDEGSLVKITSRRGSVKMRATFKGRAKPAKGSVFVPFFDETKLINQLTLDAFCPMSKEPDFKKCAVHVKRV